MNLGNLNSNNRSMSLIWIIAAGLAIVLGGLLIASFTPSIFPAQGSSQSLQVDTLFRFMLAIGGMIFLLVNGVLLYSVIRFRHRKGDNSDGPPIHGNTTLEFTWTVIPAIIVLILTVYSYTVYNSILAPVPNETNINVTAQRFAWTFTYNITKDTLPEGVTMSQLPADTQATLNAGKAITFNSPQLHTWVNQPMHVLLNSEDVDHAFWVPGMRVKQDVLPGRTTDTRFTPIEQGVYRIECAELCGTGHGGMAGSVVDGVLQGSWLVVHPTEADYMSQFYNPQAKAVLFPPTDPAVLGKQILASGAYPCPTCHTLGALNWTGTIGPHLDGVGTRAATRVAGQTAEQYITNSIRNPAAFIVPGFTNDMPQFHDTSDQTNYMPDSDLQAIVAFLLTQK